MDYNSPVTRTTTPKEKPIDCKSLGFGKYFTDHMLIMDYDEDWFAVENWIVRI